MKKFVVIAIILVAGLFLYYISQVGRGLRQGAEITTKGYLMLAFEELKEHGAFTNHAPGRCRIYASTNHYLVSGTNYQCVLVADSWDFQSASNMLAITTNQVFLSIDGRGVVSVIGMYFPPKH